MGPPPLKKYTLLQMYFANVITITEEENNILLLLTTFYHLNRLSLRENSVGTQWKFALNWISTKSLIRAAANQRWLLSKQPFSIFKAITLVSLTCLTMCFKITLHMNFHVSLICHILQAFRNSSVQMPKLAKPYSGLLNPPIHQSEWPTKARAVLE